MEATLEMQCAVDMGIAPECDCPHEHWHLGDAGPCLDLHFEEDGSCHAILLIEENELDTTFKDVANIDQARPLAMAWAQSILQPKDSNQ